jgi:hypothetical protein
LEDILRENRRLNRANVMMMALNGASEFEGLLCFAPEEASKRVGLAPDRYLELGFKIERGVPLTPSEHKEAIAFAKSYAALARELAKGATPENAETIRGHVELALEWMQSVAALGNPEAPAKNKYV